MSGWLQVHCPLAEAADVILLNLWLESDTVRAGLLSAVRALVAEPARS